MQLSNSKYNLNVVVEELSKPNKINFYLFITEIFNKCSQTIMEILTHKIFAINFALLLHTTLS